MLTINRIATIDAILGQLITSLHRAVETLGDLHERVIVNAAYRTIEKKGVALGKAEDKVDALEDARSELWAEGMEARIALVAKHRAALAALEKELDARGDVLDTKLAAAAQALVAANNDYIDTEVAARDKLGVAA